MAQSADIDDLMKGMRAVLDKAYQKGFAAGREDMRASIVALVASPEAHPAGKQINGDGDNVRYSSPGTARKPKKTIRRAPRGAVESAVSKIFDRPMTTKDAQEYVLMFDETLSPKSIYNELWRRERAGTARRDGELWIPADYVQKESAEKSLPGLSADDLL